MILDELRDDVRWIAAQTDHPDLGDDKEVADCIDKALCHLGFIGAIDYDLRTQTVYYQPPSTLEEYAHHSAYQELPAEIVTSNPR